MYLFHFVTTVRVLVKKWPQKEAAVRKNRKSCVIAKGIIKKLNLKKDKRKVL